MTTLLAARIENWYRSDAIEMPEKVYLVGAGPGDPELLTRKAWRVLQSSDVVLHDDLVAEEILRSLPATTQVVSVGKRCGAKGISQAEISALMVNLSRAGKVVARLKSGDPMLFGRGGEEMEALRRAGIEFEVIPGVTSALGAAATSQISHTDRRHAARDVFVTAHRQGGTGLTSERDVAADTTYVIFMPGHRYADLSLELQAAGIGADIPCAVISQATTTRETIFRSTVGRLAQCPRTESPSLLVVGTVVGAVANDADKKEGVEGEVLDNVSAELMDLVLQHPFRDSSGGSGVE